MVDRPIIFSAPMVRALLDGRKSQTRRVLSPGSIYDDISREAAEDFELRGWDTFWRGDILCASLARYAVDDRLWVREPWRTPENFDDRSPAGLVTSCLSAGYERAWCPIEWEADEARDNWGDWRQTPPGRLRAAMHLPRAFSRITLTVTAVRIERLQDIGAADTIAEGIQCSTCEAIGRSACGRGGCFFVPAGF